MADAPRRTRRIDDAGEKIGGARKDWRQRMLDVADLEAMTNDEAVEHVRKDNVWPQPDWKRLVDEGMPADVAAHVKIIRDRMAQTPTPRRSGDAPAQVRARFVRMTGRVRDMLMTSRTVEDVRAAERRLIEVYGGTALIRSDREVGDEYFSVYKTRRSPLTLQYADTRKVRELLLEGFPEKAPAWRKGVRLYPASMGGVIATRDGRQVGEVFPDEQAALAWLREQGPAARAQKTGPMVPKDRPHLDRIVRSGVPDHRDGRDVSPDDFLSVFGFRGVEFGNWLPDDERQKVLNLAFDALHDLAEVLAIDPISVSLEGSLSVAFGARGNGNALAHYEPGRRVLNMTRLRGAGSVAHEWAHAFDHWSGTVEHDDPSHDVRSGTGWRHYVGSAKRMEGLRNLDESQAAAWVETVDLLFAVPLAVDGMTPKRVRSNYLREAFKLCGPSGEYWSRPNELFARAFESYVFDKLSQRGSRSDYLVHGVEAERYAGPEYRGNPYPVGEERETFNGAIDSLVDAMRPRIAPNVAGQVLVR